MIDYARAFENIQKVKRDIKNMSFDDASDFCVGFNDDGTLFDFNCGNITGTIWNENGKAIIHEDCQFDVYDSDGLEDVFSGTESEIYQKIERF